MFSITSPEMLGRVLRHHRKKMGFTQAEAGSQYNMPQKTISNIESGSPGTRLETLFKYMAALNLEMQLEDRNKAAEKSNKDWQ